MFKITKMERAFALVVAVLLFNCKNSDVVNISGEVEGIDSTQAYLLEIGDSGPNYMDTIDVVNGKFHFSTKMDHEDFRLVEFKDFLRRPIVVFVGLGDDVKIKTHKDSLGLGRDPVVGSENHDLYRSLIDRLEGNRYQA